MVKKGWSKKTKFYLLTLVVGAGLIAGGVYYKSDKGSDAVAENDNDEVKIVVEEQKDETPKNYFEGTLNNSDNPTLGNFKLVSADHAIYLRTGRDFSKLVGLQVLVFFDGTMEKFELKDIQAKVADESYILPQ